MNAALPRTTVDQQIVIVAEAVKQVVIINRHRSGPVEMIEAVCELPARTVQHLLRARAADIAEAAGLAEITYTPSEYYASGRGAFGRQKGGARGRYHGPLFVARIAGGCSRPC